MHGSQPPIFRVIVLILIAGHAVQAYVYPQTMNVRTTFAILMFAACAAFVDRITGQRYAVPWLQAFGVIGMVIVMITLQLAIICTPATGCL